MRYLRLSGLVALIFLFAACNEQPVVSPEENAEETRRAFKGNSPIDDHDDALAEFEITIYNLTPATGPGASQPFSPLVVANHTPGFRIFNLGGFASDELGQIAEDAVNGPMVEALQENPQVREVTVGDGVILPGQSATVKISANRLYRKVSAVWMLVNTNDAFSAVNSIPLPPVGSKTLYVKAYDAGTEENTEMTEHIPGPCCGNPLVRVPTTQRIHFHPGIEGTGDLDPALYDWDGNVAKIVITRVN